MMCEWASARILLILLASNAFAQFEVASIKPSSPDARMGTGLQLRNGRLTGSTVTLRATLATAFGLSEPRIMGADSLDKDRFDWIAKSPDGVPDSEMKPMLQALLRDRFHLAVHRETREMPVYDLVVAKGGVKMPVYPAEEHPVPTYPAGTPMMRGTFTMSQLANGLSRLAGRPVFDKTGLTERYNLVLSFAPLTPRTADAPEFGPPDLSTALQEQLGLRLEAKKEGVEVIVVDHITRTPSEN
jgi:uncharacterized protein (TIGR03435 family)